LLTLVVAIGVPVAVWLISSGAATPGDRCSASDGGSPVGGPVSTSSQSAEEYWTPERMASAKPVPRPQGDADGC